MMILRPTLVVDGVSDIRPDVLQRLGVRGLLIDLDDTLLASHADRLPSAHRGWLEGLLGNDVPVVLLSNGERERVARLGAELGVPSFSLSGKPMPFAFRRGLAALGVPKDHAAMVGDQLFTDVVGANLAGITSILVRPLSPGGLPHTRVARHLERWILRGGEHGGPVHR